MAWYYFPCPPWDYKRNRSICDTCMRHQPKWVHLGKISTNRIVPKVPYIIPAIIKRQKHIKYMFTLTQNFFHDLRVDQNGGTTIISTLLLQYIPISYHRYFIPGVLSSWRTFIDSLSNVQIHLRIFSPWQNDRNFVQNNILYRRDVLSKFQWFPGNQ